MVFLHDRATDAGADARGHFDEAVVHLAAFNVLQRGDAVLHAVQRHIAVAGRVLLHGLENAAGRREEARAALFAGHTVLTDRNVLFSQPLGKLLERKHRVHDVLVLLRLVLLGHAGADEHRLAARVTLFQIQTVRLHRGNDVGQIRQKLRVILLNQQVDRMAAGGNHNVPVASFEHVFILGLYDRRADGGLLRAGEAQRLQRRVHILDAAVVIVGGEGGRQRNVYRLPALQKHLHALGVVDDFLRVLRAYHEAVAAQDALVADDMRLIAGEADGLHRAMPDALVAVLAVGFLEHQTIGHAYHSFTSVSPAPFPGRSRGSLPW